jgi:hypothetical protein
MQAVEKSDDDEVSLTSRRSSKSTFAVSRKQTKKMEHGMKKI